MVRRLSITGFVLLVEDAQHRLYLAVMLSAGFSIMLAYVRPYAKPINNLLALGAHLSITSTLVAGTFLRLFAGVEKGLDGDRQQLERIFGFDATTRIIITLVGFNFGFLALLVLASVYQAAHSASAAQEDHVGRSKETGRRSLADVDRPLMEEANVSETE